MSELEMEREELWRVQSLRDSPSDLDTAAMEVYRFGREYSWNREFDRT
jgi:hypothetical protein